MNGLDLTGEWWGTYFYPDHAGPATPFIATIRDDGGHIRGATAEPDQMGHVQVVRASIIGLRHGAAVDFTKVYDPGAPSDYDNPVDYTGRVSSDGGCITGVWSLLELDGRFEMYREADVAEKVEQERHVEADGPLRHAPWSMLSLPGGGLACPFANLPLSDRGRRLKR